MCSLRQEYSVPAVPDSVSFLAAFDSDPFAAGQWVKSTAEKYRGQDWKLVKTDDEGGIPGDKVRPHLTWCPQTTRTCTCP